MNKRIRKKKAKQRDFAIIVTMNEQLPIIAKYLGKMVESLHGITADMAQWLAKKYNEKDVRTNDRLDG